MKKFILFYRENTQWFVCLWRKLTRVFKDWSSYLQEVEFNKNWVCRFTILLLVFGQVSFYGQSNTNNSQWGKNGPASAPQSPVDWANGNAQGTNSHFTEGESIPTRIELAGLTPNVPASVTFDINIIQGTDGQHAFDFFTGPNRIEEIVNPLDGLTGYNPTKSTYVFPIPNAGNTGGVPASYYNETALKMACQQNADSAFPDKNSIWIYNGTISNITYVWGNENGSSTQKTYCTVTFTPTQSKALLVLGCHIAAELTVSCEGWGVGNGASTISGSPYHFHIQNICSPLNNCVTLGSQDQQMASSSVIVPPTCLITPSSASVCSGNTATFTATGINGSGGAPYTFVWTGPNGFTATTASITVGVAGTYSVIVSDKNGVPTENPCEVNLVVNNNPSPSVDDEQACVGATATFATASVPGYTYQWYLNNVLISGATNNSYTTPILTSADNGGVYKVIVIDGNHNTACDGEDAGILTVNALPIVAANDTSVCTGFTVQLSASPAGGTWSGDHVSASGLFDASGLAAGSYNVTYTYSDANQCTNSDVAVVTVNALPIVAANDASVCTGFTVQLSASPAGGTWSGDHVSASGLFDASGLVAGSYNVTYTYSDANQCSNSDVAVVTVNGLPIVAANDASVCTGFTVQLTASPAGGTWSGDHVSASGLFDSEGLAPGTYNVTYTYNDGNECTNSDGAVVTINALPVLECPDDSMDNQVQCGVSVALAQSTTNSNFDAWFNSFATLNSDPDFEVINVTYVYTPLNAEPTEGHAPLNPTLGVADVVETSVLVTWTVQDENGCSSSCSASFGLSYNCNLTCEASVTPVLCSGDNSGSIRVISGGSTPPYTLVISGANLQEPIVKVFQGDFDDTTANLLAGTYEYLVTDAVGITCNTGSPLEIIQPNALSLSLEMRPENCSGSATGSIEAVFSGGTPPYFVSIDGGVATEQSSPYTFLGLSSGSHSISVVDANDCEILEEINVELIPCDNDYCTYTQGFYGNYGGLGCTQDLGVVNSQIMMRKALELVGGSYNFGSVTTGNFFTLKLSDVIGVVNPRDNNIYKMLPGGGNPRKLIGFATYDMYSTWSVNDPLTSKGSRKGSINNNLLSQTMTLFFNIQVDGDLGGLELEATFATAKTIECGSNVPNMETVQVFSIPQNVINYLNSNGGATVGNLFVLANKALGGENIGGLSHSNINAAVDAINRGYDECRVGVPIPEETDIAVSGDLGDLNITAYPNPFKEYITLNYQFDYDSSVTIQIYDIKGTLLYQFEDKDVYFGKELKIDLNFNHSGGELYILKLMTTKEVVTHKIVSGNQ